MSGALFPTDPPTTLLHPQVVLNDFWIAQMDFAHKILLDPERRAVNAWKAILCGQINAIYLLLQSYKWLQLHDCCQLLNPRLLACLRSLLGWNFLFNCRCSHRSGKVIVSSVRILGLKLVGGDFESIYRSLRSLMISALPLSPGLSLWSNDHRPGNFQAQTTMMFVPFS